MSAAVVTVEAPTSAQGSTDSQMVAAIGKHLKQSDRLAIADGVGSPVALAAEVTAAARQVGGVRLQLGFCLDLPFEVDPQAFTDIRSVMPGYGLRGPVKSGDVHYLPVRLGSMPSLLAGPLKPDVVLVVLREGSRGLEFASEVAWMPAAIQTGARVLAVINNSLPAAAALKSNIPASSVTVIGHADRAPQELAVPPADATSLQIGAAVAGLVPAGATIMLGPGKIGSAIVSSLQVPVRVDSGLLTDAVVELAEKDLLIGDPVATYLVGTQRLYDWADGRELLHRIEITHDISRLAGVPFFSFNTALQVDLSGQVLVDQVGEDVFAGVGGHPDYALAAARSVGGLSVVALPTTRGGHRTLVDRLHGPASTSRSDVDVVVTEQGSADLRGLDGAERAKALLEIWQE